MLLKGHSSHCITAVRSDRHVIEEFTQQIYYDYGEKGRVAPLGYDIDDAQFIVWRAYEDALMSGKIRLGLI